jgi:hypothetical protein
MEFPFPRQQFVNAIHRMIGDAGEDIGEPSLRVNVVELRCVDERVHEGSALGAALRSGE